jgi:hypothetical protein
MYVRLRRTSGVIAYEEEYCDFAGRVVECVMMVQ